MVLIVFRTGIVHYASNGGSLIRIADVFINTSTVNIKKKRIYRVNSMFEFEVFNRDLSSNHISFKDPSNLASIMIFILRYFILLSENNQKPLM